MHIEQQDPLASTRRLARTDPAHSRRGCPSAFVPLVSLVLLVTVGLACSDDGADLVLDAASADAGPDAAPSPDSSKPITARSYGKLYKWASPIADYIQAGRTKFGHTNFERSIHDLVVYDSRLYLGYGDATYNLGRVTPIEFRYFSSPDKATDLVKEFKSDEEHLDRYRILGGDLVMAGIDAVEDAWLGNVYYKRSGQTWVKRRTLQQGVHVHDCVLFGGAWYASGSGATQTEWTANKIHAILWKSSDQGASFQVTNRRDNAGVGDIRWTRLLPVGKTLFLFGYHSDSAGNPKEMVNATFDGTTRTDIASGHALYNLWALETDPVSDSLGLVRGVKVFTVPKLIYSFYSLDEKGTLTEISRFSKEHVLDIFPIEGTGEHVLVTHDEADVEAIKKLTQFNLHIYHTTDFKNFKELLSETLTWLPRSLAVWQGSLFLGDGLGSIWRSDGK